MMRLASMASVHGVRVLPQHFADSGNVTAQVWVVDLRQQGKINAVRQHQIIKRLIDLQKLRERQRGCIQCQIDIGARPVVALGT